MQIPFFARLERAQGVLVTGCGGGMDFLGAVPILRWLSARGIPAVIGNVSFSPLERLCQHRVGPLGWVVDDMCRSDPRFTELALWPWLAREGLSKAFVAFARCGVVPMQASFEAAAEAHDLDAIVLVDGGLDALLKGDEPELATIEEDAVSVVAANLTDIPTRLLACIGFGVDAYHGGMSHHAFLENVAEAMRRGGFLGSVSATAGSPEGDALLHAMAHVASVLPSHGSVVGPSIASAMDGGFGNVHPTGDPRHGSVFLSPLMPTYWTFDLGTVAGMMGFAPALAGTHWIQDAEVVIRGHRHTVRVRPGAKLPW